MKKQVLFVLAFVWASIAFSQPYTTRIFHFKPQEKAVAEPGKMVVDLYQLGSEYSGLPIESQGNTSKEKKVTKLQQTFKRVPIDNTVAIIQTKDGFVERVIGNWVETPLHISTQARFPADYAKKQILKEFNASQPAVVEDNNLKSGTLIITNVKGDWYLAYEYFIQTEKPFDLVRVLMDAQSGKILAKTSQAIECCTPATAALNYGGTATIYTDLLNGGNYRLRGCIEASGNVGCNSPVASYRTTRTLNLTDFTNPTTNWTGFTQNTIERCALDAHWGTQYVHDYYLNVSGLGQEILYGTNFLNVLLNSLTNNAIYYQGLNRIHYGVVPNTGKYLTALDVVAHELTHGVTFHNSGLGGSGETGAINEAVSDIYAMAIENNHGDLDWLIADDFGTFRNFMDPNAESQPDTYHGFNWYYGSDNNVSVHTNCTVIDYWFYLLVNGGTGTNDLGNVYHVNGIGMADAMLLMDELQAHYLTPTTDMHEFRWLAMEAAGNLWYFCSDKYIAVVNAFYAVGLGDEFSVYDPIDETWETDITGCTAILHWEDVGAENYFVSYWKSGMPGTTTVYVPNVPTNELVIHDLMPNTTYVWSVQAVCEDFIVPTDHEDTFTTLDVCPPLTGLTATNITTCSVNLHWNAGGAWEYKVAYGIPGQTTHLEFTTNNFFTISDLQPNTTYTITVTPICGSSCMGTPQTVVITTESCPELSNVKVDNNPCYFSISWDVFPNQDYIITPTVIFPGPIEIQYPPVGDFFGAYLFLHSFEPGTIIKLEITTTCNGDDCATQTTQYFEFVVPEEEPVCDPPTNISVKYIGGARIISWDGSPNGNGYYNIEIVFDDHTETENGLYGNLYVTSTPVPDKCYTVRVQAVCGCSGDQLKSDWAEQYICPPCDPVTNLHVEEICEEWVNIGFTEATNGLEYAVRFWPASNPADITTLSPNVVWYYPHFTIYPILPGTTYIVEVTTLCDQGATGGPVYLEFTTDKPCGVISNITTQVIDASTVRISWDPSPGASYYELQYRSSSTGPWIIAQTFSNYIELTGLDLTCLIYTGKLRVFCDDCGFTSPFSSEFTFGGVDCLAGYHIGINPASHCDPCLGPCSICILDGNGNVVTAGNQPDGSNISIAWTPFPGYPVPSFMLVNQSCISTSPNYADRPFSATVRKQCLINGQLSPVCQVTLSYHFSCGEGGGHHLAVPGDNSGENHMANTDKNIGAKVSIFPNPGNNLLQINNEATEGVGYQILDVFGRIITKGEAGAGSSAKLNTANWVSGVYYVVVLSENQVIVSTTKWVKL